MAAFLAALACGLLARITRRVARPLVPEGSPFWLPESLGAGAGLLLAFSRTFWNQALAAKGGIYTLQAAILTVLILCLLNWREDVARSCANPQSSRLRALKSPSFLLACLVLGLGMGNHWETQILFFPAALAFAFFVLAGVPRDPNLRSGSGLLLPLGQGIVLFALGLSVYTLLPLRARLNPAMDWGHPADWTQFWWVLSRQEYTDLESGFIKAMGAALSGRGTWSQAWIQFGTVAAQGQRVLIHLLTDLGPLACILSLAGLWRLFQARQKTTLAFCLGLGLSFLLVVTFYFHLKPEMIWILDVFLVPVYMIQALLAACGVLWLFAIASKFLSRTSNAEVQNSPAPRPSPFAPSLAAAFLLLLALLLPFQPNWKQNDQSRAYWAYDFGRDFLDDLKTDALVLAEGDFYVMPIYYIQNIEGRRKDVIHLTSVFLSQPWGVLEVERRLPEAGLDLDPRDYPPSGPLFTASVKRLVERNRGRRPLYASVFHEVTREFYAQGEASLSPSGLAKEYFAPATREQDRRRLGLLKAMRTRHLQADLENVHPSTQFMLSNYASAFLETANFLRLQGKKALASPNPYYKEALALAPRPNRAEAWTHWGMALAEQGKTEEAIKAFQESIKIKPIFEAWSNLAGTFNTQKKYKEAVEAGKHAVELAPNSAEALNNLAIATYYLGDKNQAIALLEKAVAANPNNQSVQNNLRALRGY
jgi:hypothetical protein